MSDTSILEQRPALASRFEIVRTLGEGAAGAVYLVRDMHQDNREVALKVLVNASAFDEHTLERFRSEIQALQELNHPNIVQAYDYIELSDTIAYTMEYIEGCDLGRLTHRRSLESDEIDRIFAQLLSALHELHKNEIVHRDLKLENVLIRRDGAVKLTDLGLMKKLDSKGLTRTGILLGTAQYLPPEYIKRSTYDERGDIYAAGIVLFEVLTGTRRLADLSGMEAIEYLIKSKFQIPEVALTGMPKRYIAIIRKACHPKPAQRFQDALEMQAAFEDKDYHIQPEQRARINANISLQGRGNGRLEQFTPRIPRGLIFVGAKRTAAVLCTVLLLTIGFVWVKGLRDHVELPMGKYVGEPVGGNSSELASIEIRVDQRGTFVHLGRKDCIAGYVSGFLQEIRCDRDGVRFRVLSRRQGAIAVEITDQTSNVAQLYHLKDS